MYKPHKMWCECSKSDMWWAYNSSDDIDVNYVGPFNFLSEAQERADELNKKLGEQAATDKLRDKLESDDETN